MKELLSSLTGLMFIVVILQMIPSERKKNSEKMRKISIIITIVLLGITSEYDRIASAMNRVFSLLIPLLAGIVVTVILIVFIYRLIHGRRIR